MKLIPTNEALNIVDVGLLSVRQTTQGIRKSLGQDIRKNKIRDNTKLGLDRLEADTARTKGKEKIIEAKQPNNFIKGGIDAAVKGSKSLFSGLLKAAGWVILDWLINNLPTVVVIIEDVTNFVVNLKNNFVKIINSGTAGMDGRYNTAAALSRDLISGKIFTSEREVTKEFEKLTDSFNQLNVDIDTTFKQSIEDLEDLKEQSEQEIRDARQKLGLEPLDPQPTTPLAPTRSSEQTEQLEEAKSQLDSGEITQNQYDNRVNEILETPPPVTTQPPIEAPAQSQRPAPSPGVEPQTSGLIFQDTGKKPPGFAIGDGIGAGRNHMGLDIPAESGSALTVPSDSTITDKNFEKNYGNYVVFMDANGLEHFYGHMLEPTPYNRGDKVKPGDVIGRVGSTGRSSGPHLHWELGKAEGITGYPRRNAINPMEYGFPGSAPFTGEVVGPPRRLVSELKGMEKPPSMLPSYQTTQGDSLIVPFSLASLNIDSEKSSKENTSAEESNEFTAAYAGYNPDYIKILKNLNRKFT